MEIYTIKNLSLTYPSREESTLKNINLSINSGEFITVMGKSGCGKTTLLRLLKPTLAPCASIVGEIEFCEKRISEIGKREQAEKIGFVAQNPDNMLVTDKVWHELAFGLESIGLSDTEIRTRVSETASFFGIQNWFYKKTSELSGGQKQLLSLASVMVMQPDVLILDEPTAMTDPIAASEFITALKKINDELGTTVIIAEHRLDEVLAVSDRAVVMDNGEIIADCAPKMLSRALVGHDMYCALPAAARIFGILDGERECPVSVRDGKKRLEEYAKTHEYTPTAEQKSSQLPNTAVIEMSEVYFRYERALPDVVKNLNLTVYKGEFFALLGGNGTGKSTAVSLIAGINAPSRGKIRINGTHIAKADNLRNGVLGVLTQDVQNLFVKNTLYADLYNMTDKNLKSSERECRVFDIAALCRVEKLLNSHPYDLSGGEMQRAALAMVLLKKPEILVLDEPTKGMDAHFKRIFADILADLKDGGVTVVMVSHDIEFCAEYADRCALFFDGSVTACAPARRFFRANRFYTTSANRMARAIAPNAIVPEDIIAMFGFDVPPRKRETRKYSFEKRQISEKRPKFSAKRLIRAFLYALCFIGIYCVRRLTGADGKNTGYILQAMQILFAAAAAVCVFPQSEITVTKPKKAKRGRAFFKRAAVSAAVMLVFVPFTIYSGMRFFGDRKYYFISLLIILEIIVPFCMMLEGRRPKAREIVVISVLCAIAVTGRCAFFMLPEFKPVAAVVIISGVCFGGETGFLVGAAAGLVSNFFFGQGPWTPWQMFAFGTVGFLGGALFESGILGRTRLSLAVYSFLTVFIVYGGIMNVSSVLMSTAAPTRTLIFSALAAGLPVDMVHALSTVFFVWLCAEPMIEKLERIKVKYGVLADE